MAEDLKDIFTRVTLPAEIHRLIADLVRLQTEFLCKAQSSDEIFHLQAIRPSSAFRVVCAQRNGEPPPFPVPAALIISFAAESHKYFLTSRLWEIGGGYYEIDLADHLFMLQRRQNYRVQIPEAYKTTVRLTAGAQKLKGTIMDLSGGGMKARILVLDNKEHYRIGQMMTGQLEIGVRPSIPFKAQIRHLKEDPANPDYMHFGIEFLDLPAPVQGKLFAITMELHREMFSKW